MPREDNPDILSALRRAFADPASNAVTIKRTALDGGSRPDEGLGALLPRDWTPIEKIRVLKRNLVAWLDGGVIPNRNEKQGDADMRIDPVVIHECRVEIEGVRWLVQVELLSDDADDPAAKVHGVKRAY